MFRLSRRSLLRGAAGLAAAYWAGRLFPEDCYPALADTLAEPDVVVAQGTDEDAPEALLRTALVPLGGIERFVKPGQVVAIKPNVTWANKPHTASSTDPELLRALILMVKAAGAGRIIVMDRSVFDPPAMVLDVTGIGSILQETGVEAEILDRFVEPKSKYVDIDIPAGQAFQRVGVIKSAVQADVRINMAVAKTHIVLPVTLCAKHMMGYLEDPPGLHVSLDRGIADITGAPGIKSELHILEAIRVRVRGPAYGDGTDVTDPARVKRRNQVIAGIDPVLVDAYATTTFFGREPMEITHIKRCFEAGLGEIDLQKASSSGRLRSYRPEDIKPTPTPTATPTLTPTAPPPGPTAAERTLPAPTATPVATPTRPPARRPSGDEIVDLRATLNAPLLPAAAILGGVGVVVGRRLAGTLPKGTAAAAAAGGKGRAARLKPGPRRAGLPAAGGSAQPGMESSAGPSGERGKARPHRRGTKAPVGPEGSYEG